MTTIAVTGAAGSVGRRVVRLLADESTVVAVRAIDRRSMPSEAKTESHVLDLIGDDVAGALAGADTVVHLADDPRRRTAGGRRAAAASVATLERVLAAAAEVDCGHVVLLSSALVYGARADNPVPLTERQPRRPAPALEYAVTKARLEELAEEWADGVGAKLAILRPTTTLSERGVSYIAGALRAATSVRPEQVEPPVQFLHHDDLASAVALVAAQGRPSIYNVAPDGWIGPEVFRDLLTEAELRWPEPINDLVVRAANTVRPRPVDGGLEPYVTHPWVVANDRLRAAGWKPTYTNEEAFVVGNPEPFWRTYAQRRRQELALGAAGAVAVAAAGAASYAARRFFK